ncbi:CobW family GTP-binding protein [Teichococcus oryzae]|uniref:GTP-binding protein n=1 Tax=Teichococcus oryzae TaxID=1608942 RepID=A0A5B2TDK0_9PROT|nr:GTP-binding protein [Pseudoroseomonas oryzae]KAA2211880.1 GTP-binding protein [Pseudoroseomonas oryzae]
MQAEARLPVTLLTGFLGAGKTTLLNRLLRQEDMQGTAVLVNEFGEIGLDHLLVEALEEEAVLLQAGCLCCTIRGDLAQALEGIARRVRDGQALRRVVIETTGLADPLPILQTLMADAATARNFVLDGVVTVVDAVNGLATLERQSEAVRQAAVADRLLVSKADLAAPEGMALLLARLRAVNPVVTPRLIDASPIAITGLDPAAAPQREAVLRDWMAAAGTPEGGGAHHHHHGAHHHHGHDPNRHDARIHAFALSFDAPLPWEGLATWLEMLTATRGDAVLRVKGILDLEGQDRPVAIHGVQSVWHAPTLLPAWPAGMPRRSTLVFISRDLPRAVIEDGIAAFCAAARS